MTYKGHVVNGNIVLDDTDALPEGVIVQIEIVGREADENLHPDIVRFTGIIPPEIDARNEYIESLRKKHQ